MTNKNYDVIFVLLSPTLRYPPGGYDIVYRLASGLNKNGLKTAICFVLNIDEYIPNYYYLKNRISNKSIFLTFVIEKIPVPNFLFKLVYHHYKSLANIFFKVDYDYDILKNVPLYLIKSGNENNIPETKLIIATAWQTAYFVNNFSKVHKSIPYYLIQHSEDEPSFSGENSINAKKTYDFNFKKIVINEKVYNRFKSENPLFFHVGIDNNFYKLINSFEDRGYIMFPIRNNESKGAKYAIETIEKLLDNNKNIKIIAFGDFNRDELPPPIQDKYYYLPSRKVLRELYNKSIIFVSPSIVEGMSLPPLEAMSCGCAIITSDNGGINEYIQDGVNGLICPIKDSNCLYEKIKFLLENESLLKNLRKNGLITAENFSYENMITNFVKIIRNEIN